MGLDALLVMEEYGQLERRKVENLLHRERSYRINYNMIQLYNLEKYHPFQNHVHHCLRRQKTIKNHHCMDERHWISKILEWKFDN